MLKKLITAFYSLSFGKMLNIILLLFTVIPLVLIQQMTMRLYEKRIIEQTSNSTLSIVKANNNVLNSLFTEIETTSQLMLDSESYYSFFSNLKDMSLGDILRYDRFLSSEMAKQFSLQDEVCEAYLYTTSWIFSQNTNVIPTSPERVRAAGFDIAAEEAGGLPHWITGYDYGKSIGSEFWTNKETYEFRYPLTMVRQMNFQYSYQGSYQKLSSDTEKPILVVHVLESDVRNLYKNSINYENSLYIVANSSGTIISSDNDTFPIGSILDASLSQYFGDSGYINCTLQGAPYLLCYDTLLDKELFSLAFVPRAALLKETIIQARWMQVWYILALAALSSVIAFFLSRIINRPIQTLMQASLRVASGDFSANTPIPRERDFKLLTESFNHMEREINRLIHENYEISLREKETQLMVLSMQINPHFLYNTLHTINMLAIQNDDEETSELIVDLSEMLQYSFQNTSEKARLFDEIKWVSNYLDIMEKRYDNAFCTQMDIDEDLIDCLVPKLILQPLVENSILHGFQNIRENGVLSLSIFREADAVLICVEDNGIGMEQDKLQQYIQTLNQDSHVGISNIHRRLSLLYGDHYQFEVKSAPQKGTRICIRIPFES